MTVLAVLAIIIGWYLIGFDLPLPGLVLLALGGLYFARTPKWIREQGMTRRQWLEEREKDRIRAEGYVFPEDEDRIAEILATREGPRKTEPPT